MKAIKFLVVGLMLGSVANAGSLCSDPLQAHEVCLSMKNLRSHIMVLEAQRDLMQVNYSFLKTASESLSAVSNDVKAKLPSELKNHEEALTAISYQADQIAKLADAKSPNALVSANLLRSSCVSCHAGASSASGRNWEDIFKSDWSKITEKCNMPGRNPYSCKQMHGMISNYSYIMTAYMGGIQNFAMTGQAASEIERISGELIAQKFLHDRGDQISVVNQKAKEAVQAAQSKDPMAFEKAYAITEGCMNCHSTASTPNVSATKKPVYSLWK